MRINDYVAMNMMHLNLINKASSDLKVANTRLSTGKRINSAADDPSVMLRMSRTEAKLREQAVMKNVYQDQISSIQTKDAALSSMHDMGLELRDLAVNYLNDTLSDDDKKIIENQAKEIFENMIDVAKNTKFNEKNLFEFKDEKISDGDFNIKLPIDNKGNIIVPNENTTENKNQERPYPLDRVNEMKNGNQSESTNETNNLSATKLSNQPTMQTFSLFSALGGLLGGTGDIVGDLVGAVGDAVGDLLGGVGDAVGNLVGGVGDALGDLAGSTGDSGDNTNNDNGGNNNDGNNEIPNDTENPNGSNNDNNDNENNEGTKIEDDTNNPPVNNDFKDIFNPDLIDKFILDPIATERSAIGTEQRIIESRLNLASKNEEILANDFSRITDADIAKETMNKLKQELLIQNNVNLFKQSADNYRQYIATLLS